LGEPLPMSEVVGQTIFFLGEFDFIKSFNGHSLGEKKIC